LRILFLLVSTTVKHQPSLEVMTRSGQKLADMSKTAYAEWHERGKELYKQKQYERANVAFGRALACLQQHDTEAVAGTRTTSAAAAPSADQCQLLLETLQSLSLAQLKQKIPKRYALLCAAVAAALSCYSSSTAFKCAGMALDNIARDQQLLGSSAVQYAELQEAALLLLSEAHPAVSSLAKPDIVMANDDAWRVVCSGAGASTAELKKLLAAAVRGVGTGGGDADIVNDGDDSSSSSSSSSSGGGGGGGADEVVWLKLAGQEAYRRGDFEEAIEMVQVGLRQLQEGPTAAAASTLLSN
jgi:tetratricopeptide (TPR) repeat protein